MTQISAERGGGGAFFPLVALWLYVSLSGEDAAADGRAQAFLRATAARLTPQGRFARRSHQSSGSRAALRQAFRARGGVQKSARAEARARSAESSLRRPTRAATARGKGHGGHPFHGESSAFQQPPEPVTLVAAAVTLHLVAHVPQEHHARGEHEMRAAGREHAVGLADRRRIVVQMLVDIQREHQVKGVVGKRQVLPEGEIAGHPVALRREGKGLRREVHKSEGCLREALRQPGRHEPRAAARVEDAQRPVRVHGGADELLQQMGAEPGEVVQRLLALEDRGVRRRGEPLLGVRGGKHEVRDAVPLPPFPSAGRADGGHPLRGEGLTACRTAQGRMGAHEQWSPRGVAPHRPMIPVFPACFQGGVRRAGGRGVG